MNKNSTRPILVRLFWPYLAILAILTSFGPAQAGVGDSPAQVARQLGAPRTPFKITYMDGHPAVVFPMQGDLGVVFFSQDKARAILYIIPANGTTTEEILYIQQSYGGEWIMTDSTVNGTFWSNGEIFMCLWEEHGQKSLIIAGKEGLEYLSQFGSVKL